jgi:hypothetical protein
MFKGLKVAQSKFLAYEIKMLFSYESMEPNHISSILQVKVKDHSVAANW